ncbi:multiple sugar transport system permease protein [Archangium gephyra]|uniref:Multiple sugar transport system permease protein n=1 Tax=Archangium gephyra TaxID=48 RepID=A0AAC8QE95_9BACT|nr:sugar ABC transporter permease [Archangium gephyra]AKJ06142.1 Various polyols ABC transporter, permease component 1 [Archangium gephyra]REG27105.1 multiple sugar transport system permease protein [Archangium gephyra]
MTGSPRRNAIAGYAFLAPFLAFYFVFLIYPFCLGMWMSLHDWEIVGDYRQYIGLSNYAELWEDPYFWEALRNNLRFAAMTAPLATLLGLALALALNKPLRLYGALRAIFFASSIFSVTVVTLVWSMVLNPDRGLIANGMRAVGLEPIAFLAEKAWAMPALVVTTLWWGAGFPMALFLAGLQQIPPEVYEAARLDNASRWTVLRHITLPALARTTLLVVVLQTIMHLQVFGQPLLMTRGGPSNSTRPLVQLIYETGFRDWRVGYASATSMVLFGLMFFVALLQLRLSRQEGT